MGKGPQYGPLYIRGPGWLTAQERVRPQEWVFFKLSGKVVVRGRMDSLRSPFGRTTCVCRRYAARLNCRHADFQKSKWLIRFMFISRLPGRPLPRLRGCAHPRITHTRKNPAIVVENLTAWVAALNLHEICRFLNLIERREQRVKQDRIENVLLCLIAGYDSVQGTAGSIFVTDLACSDRYGSEPR